MSLCRATILLVLVASQPLAPATIAQEAKWPTTQWTAVCWEEGCDLNDSDVDILVSNLEMSSAWLEGLGFRPPKVGRSWTSPPAFPWEAHIGEDVLSVPDGDTVLRAHGLYKPGKLILGTAHAWAWKDDVDQMATATHELIHAVQGSYEFYNRLPAWLWFIEGTAAAVETTYEEAQGGSSSNEYYVGLWDYPLDDLRRRDGKPSRYESHRFWRWLVEKYGIGSMHTLFERLGEVGAQDDSLNAIDRGLRAFAPAGLVELYPQFIAQRIGDEKYFEGIPPPIRLHDTGVEHEAQRTGIVRPLAATPQEVIIASVGPDGVIVEIELTGPNRGALHLVVGDERYDRAPSVQGSERNVFRQHLHAPETFFVRVVNVSGDAVVSAPSRFTLTVRVLPQYVTMDVRTQPGGPSAADIDAPLSMRLDRVLGLVSPTPTALTEVEGTCTFSLVASDSDTGDGIHVVLAKEGPIVPGSYPVFGSPTPSRSNRYTGPDRYVGAWAAPLGTVTGHFGMGRGNEGLDFRFDSGRVEITSVAGPRVEGHLWVTGWRNPKPYWDREPFGPEHMSSVAQFAVFVNQGTPALTKQKEHWERECLAQPDPSPDDNNLGVPPPPQPDPPPTQDEPSPGEPSPDAGEEVPETDGRPSTEDPEAPAQAGEPGSPPPGEAERPGSPEGSSDAAVVAGGDACAVLQFTASELFTAHEFLPVDFEHPAGWAYRASRANSPLHGVVGPPGESGVHLEYILMPAPPPDVARRLRDATMEVVATLELGGETVDVHGRAFPEGGMVQAVLSVAHGKAHYELIVKVRGPRRCGIDGVEAVRDLVLRTLAVNEDTDFDPSTLSGR